MNPNTWDSIMEGEELDGGDNEARIANRLQSCDVQTIIATMKFFGATETWMRQTLYDLTVPKFRVFDWLAMSVNGRADDNWEQNKPALKVLVHAFLSGGKTPKKFIDNLRCRDYQVDTAWEAVEVD